MKRFLLFLVVAIASISIGLTIYYFSTDNEVILIRNSYLVIEDGDSISTDGLVDFKYRDEHTTLTFSARNSGSENLLTYNANEGFFTTESGKGGESKIVVTTNNKNYPELVINVLICDGSEEYPYIIKDALSLSNIKEGNKYGLDKHYKLGADISFSSSFVWQPISNFSGVFDGNFYTISNINITNESVPTSMSSVGFISVLEQGGIVKNVKFENLSIDVLDKNFVGAVVGQNKGTVMTTEVTGTISSSKNSNCYVGGIVGENYGDSNAQGEMIKAKVDRCGFEGNITLKGTNENSINTNAQTCGGIVGHNYVGVVSESCFRVVKEDKLSIGTGRFGGIVGINEGNLDYTSNIYDCYCYLANGIDETTSSYSNMGGVVYQNKSATNSNIIMGNYYNCGEIENVSSLKNGTNCVSPTEDKDKIDGQYNKYLTKVEFANSDKTVYVTYVKKAQGSDTIKERYWDFDSIWSMGANYPILNIHSAIGSTYPIDTSDIKGLNDITNAEDLYTKLSGNKAGSFKIINDIDFSSCDWAWGDSAHPLFEFNGTLTDDGNGRVIKNLKIVNTVVGNNANVGLFTKLGTNSYVKGIKFKDVTITYSQENSATRNVKNVGVLAGISDGSTISNIEIDGLMVDLYGVRFGGIVGLANGKTDKYISNVTVKNVEGRDGYFTYAGGLVGENSATIDVERFGNNFAYNMLSNIKLVANCLGGAIGKNSGVVSYVDASQIVLSETDKTRKMFASGEKFIVIGGVAGQNSGTITNVYANLNAKTIAGADYMIYVGGLVGYNTGALSLGYSSCVEIVVDGSYSVYAGGLVGANSKGTISRSIVRQGKIDCSVENYNKSISISTNIPVVGGLVGFDGQTTNSYSISECVSYIDSVKGAFAGGLAGNAHGKIERCHSGSQDKVVDITGFVAGGLAGYVPGEITDCYTVCTLTGQYTENAYESISSITELKVSTVGGFTSALAYETSKIQGCYAVVSFKGGGVRLSTCADISSKYLQGKVIGGIYTAEGTPGQKSFGKILSQSDLTGMGDAKYQSFYANIGSEDNTVWDTSNGGYPKLYNVDERVPKDKITQPTE